MNREILASLSVILVGALLRLIWASDMEFKYDENFVFQITQLAGVTTAWPSLGMASGASFKNPAMSLWVFIALKKLFLITTPVGLTRAVMIMNVLALVAFFAFVFEFIKNEEREPWLWAGALAAFNPGAIQLERKIWAQSTLPLFCMGFLAAWWQRRTRWGAFFWGFLGACLGQIHMSGFFLAAAFALWTLVWERGKPRWVWWLAGSALGLIPLIPWLEYMAGFHGQAYGQSFGQIFTFAYWENASYWVHWFLEPLGAGLKVSLGKIAFLDFSHGIEGALYAASEGLGILMILLAAFSLIKRPSAVLVPISPTVLAMGAAFLITGLLMTLSGATVYRHYLIVAFPFPFLWYARAALSAKRIGRAVLGAFVLAQLGLSVGFLSYIHENHGAPHGDYGVGYQWSKR